MHRQLQVKAWGSDNSTKQAAGIFQQKAKPSTPKYSVTEQDLLAVVETLNKFKGMTWGQTKTVYTDHKNLMQDAQGLTSD